MAVVKDGGDVRLSPAEAGEATVVPFKRHLLMLGLVMAAAELAFVAYPLWAMFDLAGLGSSTVLRLGLPTAIGATVAWVAIMTAWLVPIRACVVAHRKGERAAKALATRGYRACINTSYAELSQLAPVRALIGRTLLWIVIAGTLGAFLVRYRDWSQARALAMTSVAGLHAAPLAAIRAAWLDHVLRGIRGRLFVITPPVRIFAERQED